MAKKGKKKVGGKREKRGNREKRGKRAKKGKKGKEKKKGKPPKKTALEIKLTEHMKNRVNKKMRPMKILQEKFKKLLEFFETNDHPSPFIDSEDISDEELAKLLSDISLNKLKAASPKEGSMDSVVYVKETAMVGKRKGDEDDSPINIDTSIVKKVNYQKLKFEGLFDPDRKTVITNSGYHVIGSLEGDVFVSNGPLFGKYKLDSFHVHYGERCDDGTEHTINGRRFTLEMHMVFRPYCDHYGIIGGTYKMTAKKVVIGLMFKLSLQPTHYDIFDIISHIDKAGKSLETSNNMLADFKDVLIESEYYNYSGSGTEGEFKEYEWMLFKKVLPISKSQMQNMWDLRKFNTEKRNIKPIQPLGERTICTPYYYDHQKCRGKEVCECYGISKPFKTSTLLRPGSPLTKISKTFK